MNQNAHIKSSVVYRKYKEYNRFIRQCHKFIPLIITQAISKSAICRLPTSVPNGINKENEENIKKGGPDDNR